MFASVCVCSDEAQQSKCFSTVMRMRSKAEAATETMWWKSRKFGLVIVLVGCRVLSSVVECCRGVCEREGEGGKEREREKEKVRERERMEERVSE